MALRFRAELIEPAPVGGWYVSNGDQSVGPVALELLVRGVETGRVPTEAFVRHEAWKVWRPLSELTTEEEQTDAELSAALVAGVALAIGTTLPQSDAGVVAAADSGPATIESSAQGRNRLTGDAPTDDEGPATIRESSPVVGMPMAPAVVAARALALAAGEFPAPFDLSATFDALAAAHGLERHFPDPDSSSRASRPPRSSRRSAAPRSSTRNATDDVASAARPAESSDRMEGDELAGAVDLREALLLFLGAVVRRLDADGALLHRVDEMGAVVACAHGAAAGDALGARTRLTDPSFLAASAGYSVIAEPNPGPGGTVLRARVEGVAGVPIAPGAAGMFPVVAGGRLRAFLEVGRERPMTMRDWAEADRLVRSLVARIHAAEW